MTLSRRHILKLTAALPIAVATPVVAAAEKMTVVATTGMIADAAMNVGGDAVEVQTLMGPGVDPHAYRQTRTDILAMNRADLVLWHGLYLEAQMEELLLEMGEKKPVVAVGEAVAQDKLIAHEDYAGRFDPHVWMVPALWADVVRGVQAAMTEVAPDQADVFEANATAYIAEIERLGAYTKDALPTVPAEARVLLTAHDAFGYFGSDYGFEVMGIQGISTESEAGLDRIAELVDLLVARDFQAVFVETSVSDRIIKALIEGAAAKGHDVKIGGELYSDAMGEPGTYEGTYLGMIDHNVTTIAGARGGDVPAGGMDGKLSAGG